MRTTARAAGLAVVLALSFTSVAGAAAPTTFGGANGGAWVSDFPNHYVNTNNTAVRKDLQCDRKTSPGKGGYNANANSSVSPGNNVYFPEQATLVDPHDTAAAGCVLGG